MFVYPKPEEFVIHEGKSFRAEWYYTEGGVMPAFDFYQKMTEVDRRAMDKMVVYFCNRSFGEPLPPTWYRIEDAEHKIYAFKPRAERFFNFTIAGRKVIITNAYHKHSQKMTKLDLQQLKISARYRDDYYQRFKEGTYYER